MKDIIAMVKANESLKQTILNGNTLTSKEKNIISIEIYFLLFSIFKNSFTELPLNNEIINCLLSHNYSLISDGIITEKGIIKTSLLKEWFELLKQNLLENKVLSFPRYKVATHRETIKENLINSRHLISNQYYNINKNIPRHILRTNQPLNNYTERYLKEINYFYFRQLIKQFTLMLAILNNDKNFEFEDLNPSFLYLLISLYPIFVYGQNKISINYDYFNFPKSLVYKMAIEDPRYTKLQKDINTLSFQKRGFEKMIDYNGSEISKKKLKQYTRQLEYKNIELKEFLESSEVRNKAFFTHLVEAIFQGYIEIVDNSIINIYVIKDSTTTFAITTDIEDILDFINNPSILEILTNKEYKKVLN